MWRHASRAMKREKLRTPLPVVYRNLEGKLCAQQLGNIKLLPRFHLKALEYLIQMDVVDDIEQTEGYLAALKVRKLAKDESINKKREQQQQEEDDYEEEGDDNDDDDDEDHDNDDEDDDDDDNEEENDSSEKEDVSDN